MIRLSRLLATCVVAAALAVVFASGAAAQEGGHAAVRDITRLGGSTAFYKPSLTNVASLKRMGDSATVVADIRNVLSQAGLPDLATNVAAALAGASTSVRGGDCAAARPEAGTIVECDVQPGQTLRWMAYRPQGGANYQAWGGVRLHF
jgi:hypothetical protein